MGSFIFLTNLYQISSEIFKKNQDDVYVYEFDENDIYQYDLIQEITKFWQSGK